MSGQKGGFIKKGGGCPIFLLSLVENWCNYTLTKNLTWTDKTFNFIMSLFFFDYYPVQESGLYNSFGNMWAVFLTTLKSVM